MVPKFRAPHPDTGVMYYFQFYPTVESDLPGPPNWSNDWAGTVEIWTGWYDKNGKEVYSAFGLKED